MNLQNVYQRGLRDGLPIALGYLSVSFTFGMMAVEQGLPWWAAVIISMTNLTSAGQFAGLGMIVAGAPYAELALAQLVINLRYALMSFSLSQKLESSVARLDRCLIAFGNTDEIFAVASGQPGLVGKKYMYGLITLPFIGWTSGTFIGAQAGAVLPDSLRSALGIAIYAMFLAIIIPPAKRLRGVRAVILISCTMSCMFAWLPILNQISQGFSIILCTVISATVCALLFPVKEARQG